MPTDTTVQFRHNAAPTETIISVSTPFPFVVCGFIKNMSQDIHAPSDARLPENEREKEINRFWTAYQKTVQTFELRAKKAEDTEEELSLFEKETIENIRKTIRSKATDEDIKNRNADAIPSSFKKVLDGITDDGKSAAKAAYDVFYSRYLIFNNSDSANMKQTGEEVRDTLQVFLSHYDPRSYPPLTNRLRKKDIVFAPMMGFGDVPDLIDENGQKRVTGIFLKAATITGHPVIASKANNIPLSWVDNPKMLEVIETAFPDGISDGTSIIMDGTCGEIIINPTDQTWDEFKELQSKFERGYAQLLKETSRKQSMETLDGEVFKNNVNADTPAEVRAAMQYNPSGVGLVRTEQHVASLPADKRNLTTTEWKEFLISMIEANDRNNTTVRLLDFDGDKDLGFSNAQIEEMDDRLIEAFLEVREKYPHKKPQLMAPMIRSGEQLARMQERINTIAKNKNLPAYKLGSMSENPAFLAELKQGWINPAFISTGSNDKTAYTLGINRINQNDADANDPTHIAVLQNIEAPVAYVHETMGHGKKLPVSICGDIASQPRYFGLVTGAGYRNLSMAPAILPVIKTLETRIDTGIRFEKLKATNPDQYKKWVKRAQKDNNPDNAWALKHRIMAEPSREKREHILEVYNEKYLGLHPDGTVKLDWTVPENKQELQAIPTL